MPARAESFAPLATRILPELPKLTTVVCLDGSIPGTVLLPGWLDGVPTEPWEAEPPDDVVMLVGTGGTTGRPAGSGPACDDFEGFECWDVNGLLMSMFG